MRKNLFTSGVNCDVAVTWRIPPPNRSPSFEVSAIFYPEKFDDIRRNARPCVQLISITMFMVPYVTFRVSRLVLITSARNVDFRIA